MDGDCFTCKKQLGNEVCIFDQKYYHKSCCQFCKHLAKSKVRESLVRTPIEPIFKKEKSPLEFFPEPKVEEPKRPTKIKSGPGRLNFAKYEILSTMDVKCYTCKLSICGQRFLSKKIGQFNCYDCHLKLAPKCHMCKLNFETGQSIFKDENQNKYCEKCINIHYDELRKQKIDEQFKKKELKRQQSLVNNNNEKELTSGLNNQDNSEIKQCENPSNDSENLQNLRKQQINSNNFSLNSIDLFKQQPQVAKVAKKSKSPSKSPHNSSSASRAFSPKLKAKRFIELSLI